jgi:hypothetical protein
MTARWCRDWLGLYVLTDGDCMAAVYRATAGCHPPGRPWRVYVGQLDRPGAYCRTLRDAKRKAEEELAGVASEEAD